MKNLHSPLTYPTNATFLYFHWVITDHTPMLWSRLSASLWARLSWSGDTRSGLSLRMRDTSPRGHRDHRDIGSTFRDGLQDVVAIIKTAESASQIKLLLGIIGHRHQTASPSYCGPQTNEVTWSVDQHVSVRVRDYPGLDAQGPGRRSRDICGPRAAQQRLALSTQVRPTAMLIWTF